MVSVDVWVNANHHPPHVVELNVSSRKPVQVSVSIEPWRRVRRKINNKNELDSAFGFGGPDITDRDAGSMGREDQRNCSRSGRSLIILYPFFQFLV